MSNVSAVRNIMQAEELTSEAAVSSGTATRIGEALQFHNLYQLAPLFWNLNGRYGGSTAAQTGVDGALPIFTNCDIVGFFMFNQVAGASGITEIDILRHTASGAGATIFSVRPSISYVAGNLAFISLYRDPSVVLENPAGTVLPTFSQTQLNAGDALTLNFVTRQLNANGLTVSLAVRPR